MHKPTEQRSRTMRAVKGQNTTPERVVRKLLFSMGYRYRLHRKELPGKPDIAFIKQKKVIFIHGCFWHGHTCLRGNRCPKTNQEYWTRKIHRNIERDTLAMVALQDSGWQALIIWECELKRLDTIAKRIEIFLDPSR